MRNAELERYYRALANRKRLEIVQLLAKQGPLPVKDIAELIKLSFKSTHKHLHHLLQIGFLDKERRRNLVFYNLAQDRLALHRHLLKPAIG